MSEYDNELSGVIFRQSEKKTDKSPDYWGKMQVSGVEYKLAGWIREGKNGKFISVKLTPPENSREYTPKEDDDQAPF